MLSASVTQAMAPALVFFCFLTCNYSADLSGEAKLSVMVNPLPIQRLNFQNVGQKLRDLKQLLLNHPVKVFVTLVISRGLWIPLLKNLALYGFVGISVALRILFYSIEFAVSKLPKRCRKGVEIYLQDTLDILLRPLSVALDLTAAVVKQVFFGETHESTEQGHFSSHG